MAKAKAQRVPRFRRLAIIAGGAVATALCFSLAWGAIGGALAPAASPLPGSIVIATASQPAPPPPLPPRHRPARPAASAKIAVSDSERSFAKTPPPRKAVASASALASDEAPSSQAQSQLASTLLQTDSKASRTRGQPAQD